MHAYTLMLNFSLKVEICNAFTDVQVLIFDRSAGVNKFLASMTAANQCLRCLRHELSLSTQTLGSLVQIPFEIWLFLSVSSMFVLSCVQVAALRLADHNPRSPTNYVKRSRH
jgi:hypothetical protein